MSHNIENLLDRNCKAINSSTTPLNLSEIEQLRKFTPQWQYCANENVLCQTFHFSTYQETIAFVNLVASIAVAEDHHPEMIVGFQRCKVSYATHTISGISINDFICAAKIDDKADEI